MPVRFRLEYLIFAVFVLSILFGCISTVNATTDIDVSRDNTQNITSITAGVTQSILSGSKEDAKQKSIAIESIQRYKENETYWQKKISSDLLQIIDPNYPLSGMTQIQSKDAMQKEMQLIPGEKVASELNVTADTSHPFGDTVCVEISFDKTTSHTIIDPHITKIISSDSRSVSAWVELDKIESVAKLNGVLGVRLIERGISNYMNQPYSGISPVEPNNESELVISQVTSMTPTSSPLSSYPTSPVSLPGVLCSIILSGLIFLKFYRN